MRKATALLLILFGFAAQADITTNRVLYIDFEDRTSDQSGNTPTDTPTVTNTPTITKTPTVTATKTITQTPTITPTRSTRRRPMNSWTYPF